jgi:hypothetical protein
MGFGLDDWIYCTLYIHTTQGCRQYGAITILHILQFTVPHALGFSIFTSHLLAMDLSQCHCNFKSHMKSSLHRLICLPFLLNHLGLPIPKTRPLFCTPCYSAYTPPVLPNISYNHSAKAPRKTPSSVVENVCLLIHYLAIDVLLFTFASAGTCLARLPSNGYTHHNIYCH